MGCDGGSIPRRDELVKTKKKAEKVDSNELLKTLFFTCFLSKLALNEPVVACILVYCMRCNAVLEYSVIRCFCLEGLQYVDGVYCPHCCRLYNKQSILNYLIDKKSFGDADIIIPHINNLKDVKSLNLTPNPLFGKDQTSSIVSAFNDKVQVAPFICPITQKEMNGHSRFVYFNTCGCVLSEQAIKNVTASNCIICNTPFSSQEDIILINPISEQDLTIAKTRLEASVERKKQEKLLKKQKKEKDSKKRKSTATGDDAGVVVEGQDQPGLVGVSSSSDDEKKKKKTKVATTDTSSARTQQSSNINMALPDLSSLNAAKSKAIQSLYHKNGEGENKGNYLTKGTFNRYSAA